VTSVQAAATPAPPPLRYSETWLAAHPQPRLEVTAASAILVDLDARQVLWERSPADRRAPASLTKMVTAMVAVDHARLDRELTVPPEAARMEPDVMGLSAGEIVTVEDLLYGLFLDSGNDAAETLARAIIPRSRFLAEMNAKARLLGLADTSFANPTGLDAPGHYSSAYDLAVVAGYLETRYPQLAAIASARERPIPATAGHKAFDPRNLNKLVWNYPGANGLKTGLTDEAGGCVAGSATRGGRHLVVLVMGSKVFFTEAERLLDYGFSTSIAG
jgi:serine-type D-Ala-D-Ala carboxypeptidase (penicillin-binding protein 5/6)